MFKMVLECLMSIKGGTELRMQVDEECMKVV